METRVIDSLTTRATIRNKYGSVLAFCKAANVTNNYLSQLLTIQRRRHQKSEGQIVLQRLEDEGLLVYVSDDSQEVSNG